MKRILVINSAPFYKDFIRTLRNENNNYNIDEVSYNTSKHELQNLKEKGYKRIYIPTTKREKNKFSTEMLAFKLGIKEIFLCFENKSRRLFDYEHIVYKPYDQFVYKKIDLFNSMFFYAFLPIRKVLRKALKLLNFIKKLIFYSFKWLSYFIMKYINKEYI